MEGGGLTNMLHEVSASLPHFATELFLGSSILILIFIGLFRNAKRRVLHSAAAFFFLISFILAILQLERTSGVIFNGMFRTGNSFADYFKILFSISGFLTVAMTWRSEKKQLRLSEFYALLFTVVLGANLLAMAENLLAVFLALEMISIPSYVLTGFSFDKKATEGSLKYFLFGSISSAVMVYGISILYGIFGTLNYTEFHLPGPDSLTLFYIAGTFTLAGFLFKIAAVPMHPWAPDVYESAPMPVVAFFSVVPKIAGVAILMKFVLYCIPAGIHWQLVISGIAILTLLAGNFSALWQKNVRRLMAYSSIAQSGFLLVSVAAGSLQGAEALVFYSSIYVLMTFLLFFYLQNFENRAFTTIAAFEGTGKAFLWPSIFMLIGFIALTGLPPTAGFTGKLFLFSALWESYAATGNQPLLWLLVFGLLNTVVSLFYYLRIPYYAFIRPQQHDIPTNNLRFENLLGGFLVLLILLLFFSPQLLMGWINKGNFAF
jgi:NADH-quinone oxidoreductase subunit N